MMNNDVLVTACVGHYRVSTTDRQGVQTCQVFKDKRCTCGGTAKRPCQHIRAVAKYLRAGGQRAPAKRPPLQAHKPRARRTRPNVPTPLTCPICNSPTKREALGRWRCPGNSSHYFQWRGEQGVRQFLTQPHPAKQGALYDMSPGERKVFLEKAERQMYATGYTPYA
jgi:hypothetical protein